jgi:hypothetical protein
METEYPVAIMHRLRSPTVRARLLGLCLILGITAHAQVDRKSEGSIKGTIVTSHASGSFDVKLSPQKPESKEAENANIGRMSIDKQFHGELEAISRGEMIAVMSDVKGSAGYVAMERVTGILRGRSGTFALQHSGVMTRGEQQLTIAVVPDSGTGQLVGLTGKMNIRITEGKHFYDFDYTLPETERQ